MMASTTDIIVSRSAGPGGQNINAICLGSGRFLRSVLVPFLSIKIDLSRPAVFQTRGRTFLDSFSGLQGNDNSVVVSTLCYPVDTVEFDGSVTTSNVEIYAAGTLGTANGKSQLMDGVIFNMKSISVIGVGVTEAGLQRHENQCMLDLTEMLNKIFRQQLHCPNPNGKICVINTDNVPNNGDVIRSHVLKNAVKHYNDELGEEFIDFLNNKVVFLNSMVDRITSSRPLSYGLVPYCEPLPKKALVICDEGYDLPSWMHEEDIQDRFGVKIRHDKSDLESDIALKLRVANGTHTAVAHCMALLSLINTDALSTSKVILAYLDSLYQMQILPAAINDGISADETEATWDDWRRRLQHPHFGLSTFFITQNGAAKCGIRLGQTIESLLDVSVQEEVATGHSLSVAMAFAVAAILRFLTPIPSGNKLAKEKGEQISDAKHRGIFTGWLDTGNEKSRVVGSDSVTYADGLRYNLGEGWYEFRCNCLLTRKRSNDAGGGNRDVSLPDALARLGGPRQPCAYEGVIRSYLLHPQGGNLQKVLEGDSESEDLSRSRKFNVFVSAVSTLYARMVSGDSISIMLQEMMERQHVYANGFATPCSCLDDSLSDYNDASPLHYSQSPIPSTSNLMKTRVGIWEKEIHSVVFSEVRSQKVIDLHTHLLPPSHGALCLWGIDELLTYHYLVAEYFMTARADISPEGFYMLTKQKQADLIWDALFVQRSPISEATRGVLTTLVALGLEAEVKARDLDGIRKFYNTFQDDGLSGVESFVDKVMSTAGVRYAIMTNIPFDSTEIKHWRPKKKEYPSTFKSALRVDPLLAGDRETIETALKASGYGTTLEDTRKYLHDWCETMQPEYMMASTPHDFYFDDSSGGSLAGVKKLGLNEDAMKRPFAFTEVSGDDCNNCEDTDNIPSVINEQSDYLGVLMKVCEERNLPLALKIGAHRKINPELQSAGDGMVAFADAGSLARLCGKFPKVRFLATFLSRSNQHEAAVLANKFRNLHLYGCWWYCNNPSIIREITQMRIEMLGTAFTAQHSDARVIDQLVYKWAHSRAVIAKVLAEQYEKTLNSSWQVTREEIRRDISRVFGGGSYEEFMEKVLQP